MTCHSVDGQRDRLIATNTEDMLTAWGLERYRRSTTLRLMCRPAATWFARQVLTYDAYIGEHGLAAATGWMLRRHVRHVRVAGEDAIPRTGPLLVVANHPGLTDTLALAASVPRPDLRIIAADRPFLRSLPNLSRSLLYISEGTNDRFGVTRTAIGHTRAGGALLTFPGGGIEPDPALRSGARIALAAWSESIGLFVRAVPGLQVVPAIVRGVLATAAQHHPLTRLRRQQADRERLAAMVQLLTPAYRRVDVDVMFGRPLTAAELSEPGRDARAITRAIIAHAASVLESAPTDWRAIVRAPTRRED